MIIDPVTNTTTFTNFGLDLLGSGKWSGLVAAPDGRLYGIPFSSTKILVITPDSNIPLPNVKNLRRPHFNKF